MKSGGGAFFAQESILNPLKQKVLSLTFVEIKLTVYVWFDCQKQSKSD